MPYLICLSYDCLIYLTIETAGRMVDWVCYCGNSTEKTVTAAVVKLSEQIGNDTWDRALKFTRCQHPAFGALCEVCCLV